MRSTFRGPCRLQIGDTADYKSALRSKHIPDQGIAVMPDATYGISMIDVTEIQPRGVDRFETRRVLPPAQVDALSSDILALKKKLNAIILAHNYQVPEIQDV